MNWQESKDAGRQAFSEGRYPEALTHYIEAIDRLSAQDEGGGGNRAGGHTSEHQILLSNVIACRLKVGGQNMVEKAVDEAKQCIALNDQWPKAHVRLASAYIALGGHSNDACLSLQRALSLDRNNKVAREMLVKEMRQRNFRERNGANSSGNEGGQEERDGSGPTPPQHEENTDYHPTEETPRHSLFPDASAPPRPSQSMNGGTSDGIDVDDIEPPDAYYSLSYQERIQHHIAQFTTWYHSQSDDIQTLLKVACFFAILYVALGGRFGLNYALGGNKDVRHRGNYGNGNAYEKYYSSTSSSSTQSRYSSGTDRHQARYGSRNEEASSFPRQRQHAGNSGDQTSTGYNDRTRPQNDRYYSRYEDGNYYEPPPRRRSTSYGMPNLFDGSLISMAVLFVIGMVCHRFGINPFHLMWMLNMMQRRGGHHRRMGYGAYPGGGMGGMGGFGFGRRRGYGARRY